MSIVSKLIQGDCLEKLTTIPTNSIHTIISDIPYGISHDTWDVKHNNKNSALLGASPAQKKVAIFKTRGKPRRGWSLEDKKIPLEYQKFCENFLFECHRILMPASALICFTGRQLQHRFICAGENVGFFLKDIIAWDKTTAPFRAQHIDAVLNRRGVPTKYPKVRLGNLAPIMEPIVYMGRNYASKDQLTDCFLRYGTGCFNDTKLRRNLIAVPARISNRQHPTQKPEALMEILIETFTLPGQTILDMFMGSGTTGVAAKKLGRNFIGIEKDERYYEIAKARILE